MTRYESIKICLQGQDAHVHVYIYMNDALRMSSQLYLILNLYTNIHKLVL